MATIQSSTDPRFQPTTSLRDRLSGLIAGATSYLPSSMQSYPDIPQMGVKQGTLAKDLMTPAENLPVVGQALSAEDLGTAAKNKDWWGMGLAALGMMPGGGVEKNAAKEAAKGVEALVEGGGRQVLAKAKDPEWFHPAGSGVKLKQPFSTMTHESRPTGNLRPDKPITAEDLQGGILFPLYGDRTKAGEILTSVNGVQLPREQHLGGGGRFMQENPGQIWASEKGRITSISDEVREHAKGGKPVFGVHVAMGPESGDFARMTTRPLLDLTQKADLSPEAITAFDAKMAEKVKNWPGIRNADDQWLATAPGGARTELAKLMALGQFQKQGFPDLASLRKAITEPELHHASTLTSGMSVGKFDPEGRIIPSSGHDTYSTGIAGEHVGNMGQVPFSVMFPDFLATRPVGEKIPNTARTVETTRPVQEANQQWVDNYMNWLRSLGTAR